MMDEDDIALEKLQKQREQLLAQLQKVEGSHLSDGELSDDSDTAEIGCKRGEVSHGARNRANENTREFNQRTKRNKFSPPEACTLSHEILKSNSKQTSSDTHRSTVTNGIASGSLNGLEDCRSVGSPSGSDVVEDIDIFFSNSRKRPLVNGGSSHPVGSGISGPASKPKVLKKRQRTLSDSSGSSVCSNSNGPWGSLHVVQDEGSHDMFRKVDLRPNSGRDDQLSEPDDNYDEDLLNDLKVCDEVMEQEAIESFDGAVDDIALSDVEESSAPAVISAEPTNKNLVSDESVAAKSLRSSGQDAGVQEVQREQSSKGSEGVESCPSRSGTIKTEPSDFGPSNKYNACLNGHVNSSHRKKPVLVEKSGQDGNEQRETGTVRPDGEPEFFYDSSTSVEDALDDADVDKMLEQPIKTSKDLPKFDNLKEPPIIKEKTVLKYRGKDYFELLPHGWIEVTHSSGIPVYLHKQTRVCTFARPYFIGPGSVRHHEVPLSSIPCLYQRQVQEWEKESEREQFQRALSQVVGANAASGDGVPQCSNGIEQGEEDAGSDSTSNAKKLAQRLPEVKVATLDDIKKRNLTPPKLRDYCEKAFKFETVRVWRFRNWTDHRTFHKDQRRKQRRPTLPSNVKLITVPASNKNVKPQKRQFYLNPHGKTSVSLLHEYVQRVMHCSPEYDFGQTSSASDPYSATVIIQGVKYAQGYGNNKRNAKLDAAKKTLSVLIPDMDFNSDATVKLPNEDDVLELFDLFSVTDNRVYELSVKAGQPPPFQILNECLRRNAAFGDTKCKTDIVPKRHQQHEFTMTVGKHVVKVTCSNKKDGKQKASQAMLEKLHPHIKTWGSLIRLYGYGTARTARKSEDAKGPGVNNSHNLGNKPNAPGPSGSNNKGNNSAGNKNGASNAHQTASAATPAAAPAPNKAILDKLQKEMLKLYEETQSGDQKEAKAKENALVAQAVKNLSL